MAGKPGDNPTQQIRERDIEGLKYLKSLLPLLESLHDVGTERDRAGNRRLHMDKNGQSQSAWRLHTHFDIDRHLPTRIDVTSARNGGKTDERNVLRDRLAADHCYVMDRWYAEFTLFNEIVAAGSVCSQRGVAKNSR